MALKTDEIGPWDHGRRFSEKAFFASRFTSGFRYELIYGRLHVIAWPEVPHDVIEQSLWWELTSYAHRRKDVLQYVTNKAWVQVEHAPGATWVRPDVAAYRSFPPYQSKLGWDAVNPCVVVEVMTSDTLDRDLVLKADVYFHVPSIQEYWVVSELESDVRPRLRVHRRQKSKWEISDMPAGVGYRTDLLPRFQLKIDPLRR